MTKNEHKNDVALALGINLCLNGGAVIFCGRKDTADKVLERILDIENRGYDISNLIQYFSSHPIHIRFRKNNIPFCINTSPSGSSY